jgi:hypothetical protein
MPEQQVPTARATLVVSGAVIVLLVLTISALLLGWIWGYHGQLLATAAILSGTVIVLLIVAIGFIEKKPRDE